MEIVGSPSNQTLLSIKVDKRVQWVLSNRFTATPIIGLKFTVFFLEKLWNICTKILENLNLSRRDWSGGGGTGSRSSVRKILSICEIYFSVFARNTFQYLLEILWNDKFFENMYVSRQDCGRGAEGHGRDLGHGQLWWIFPNATFNIIIRQPQVENNNKT